MKIGIIAHFRFPLREPYAGGLEMITHHLVKELEKEGHDITVFAREGSDCQNLRSLESYAGFFPEQLQIEGDLEERLAEVAYARIFRELDDLKFDLIHNHSLHHLPIILGNELQTPFITSLHTPAFPEIKLALHCVRANLNQQFTAVSENLSNYYSAYIPKPKVVYNGIDIEKWQFSPVNSGKYCIWYGRFCKEKAPHLAIEAAILAQLPIVLAGPGEGNEYFEEMIRPHLEKYPEIVHFIGHVDQQELNILLNDARAFLFTSVWEEPYGLAIAESLAAGTPVISWDKGAAPEILTEECGILLPEADVNSMAKALHACTEISRVACRERALNFCGNSQMVRAFTSLYERSIQPKKELC